MNTRRAFRPAVVASLEARVALSGAHAGISAGRAADHGHHPHHQSGREFNANDLIKKGDNLINQGNDLIQKQHQVKQGNALIQKGESLVTKGQTLLIGGTSSTNGHHHKP